MIISIDVPVSIYSGMSGVTVSRQQLVVSFLLFLPFLSSSSLFFPVVFPTF